MHLFLKFIFGIKLYMFRTVPLSIIRSFSLYTQQWYMSYRFADNLRVQWRTPDDGQRNCPKHLEFYSKNKFEKFVHLVGFVIIIYQDARSPERQIHYNLRKATISFVMSACPSIRPYVCTEQLGSRWTDYHEILHFWHVSKIRRENSSFIKIWRY